MIFVVWVNFCRVERHSQTIFRFVWGLLLTKKCLVAIQKQFKIEHASKNKRKGERETATDLGLSGCELWSPGYAMPYLRWGYLCKQIDTPFSLLLVFLFPASCLPVWMKFYGTFSICSFTQHNCFTRRSTIYCLLSFFPLVSNQTLKIEKTKNILHTHKVKIYDSQCFQFAFCSELSFIMYMLIECTLLMESIVASLQTKLHLFADMYAFKIGTNI